MPVELRKRKAADPAPSPPAKKQSSVAKAATKVKQAIAGTKGPKGRNAAKTNGSTASKVVVGQAIALEGFGGEIETHDGQKTTLKKLVDESKTGVVLFTYPKASTPGCTTQACLFRDSYTPLTATGFSIYGLSGDSPKSNTAFKEKQKLPYSLLCDPSRTLVAAIGLKKAPSGTIRGVFVVDKSGKVLAAEPGGPAATVEVVKKLVGGSDTFAPIAGEGVKAAEADGSKVTQEPKVEAPLATSNGVNGIEKNEDVAKANVAAEVADTAEKIDSNEAAPAPA